MRANLIMFVAIVAIVSIIVWQIYDAGGDAERKDNKINQYEANENAHKRKAAVVPADSNLLIDSLRNGSF